MDMPYCSLSLDGAVELILTGIDLYSYRIDKQMPYRDKVSMISLFIYLP